MAGQASWISRIRPRPSTTCRCDEDRLGFAAILSHVQDRSISVTRSRVLIHEPTTSLLMRRDRLVVPFTLRGWFGSDRPTGGPEADSRATRLRGRKERASPASPATYRRGSQENCGDLFRTVRYVWLKPAHLSIAAGFGTRKWGLRYVDRVCVETVNRTDLQRLAQERIDEAELLLNATKYSGGVLPDRLCHRVRFKGVHRQADEPARLLRLGDCQGVFHAQALRFSQARRVAAPTRRRHGSGLGPRGQLGHCLRLDRGEPV